MKFHLYSVFWGQHYLDLFKRCCFKSLQWPLNASAVHGATWNIYTQQEFFPELERLFKGTGFNVNVIPIGSHMRIPGISPVSTGQCGSSVVLLEGLREELMYCEKKQEKMLLCPPDTIFGDGSVANILKIGSQPFTCVSVSHPRVNHSIIEDMEAICATSGPISNPQLVDLMMKHAHESWTRSEVDHPRNCSFGGGISWKRLKLNHNLYAVTHVLPTVYLAGFHRFDWDFWWSQNSFGSWDHRWPGENLIRLDRLRHVGSSDGAMIVEVTDWDKNVPEEADRSKIPNIQDDSYRTNHYHTGVFRQFSTIFRGS